VPRPQIYAPVRPYAVVPDGWDTAWKAAKLLAGSSPLPINIIGDSISAGGGTASFTTSYAEKLLTQLQTVYGRYADSYHAWINQTDAPITGAPWVDNQTCTRVAGQPWTGTVISAGVVAGAVQTFTTPYACTALDFLYYSGAGDGAKTFNYTIDGGANNLVTNPGDNAIHRIAITALANTTHTFAWGTQSAGTAVRAMGCVTYKPGATIGLAAGRLQASSNKTTDVNDGWLRNSQLVTGVPTGPALAIIQLGTNDINANATPAAVEQQLRNVCRALKGGSGTKGCSTLFVITSYPDTTYDDSNPAGYSFASTAFAIFNSIYSEARRSCSAIIDFHAKWGATPFGQGFLTATDLHPTNAGHTDMYNAILPLL
jgi:lysophospholipase L1-like esterase